MKKTKVLLATVISERYGRSLGKLVSMNERDAELMRRAFPKNLNTKNLKAQELCDDIWSYRSDLLSALLKSYHTGEMPDVKPPGCGGGKVRP